MEPFSTLFLSVIWGDIIMYSYRGMCKEQISIDTLNLHTDNETKANIK